VKSIYDQEYRDLIGRLVARRKSVGMTQKDLAEKLGWPQPAVSKVETFVRRIDVVETMRICEALGWTLVELTKRN